jgi:hypothetical protein
MAWWEKGFRHWRGHSERRLEYGALNFLCELGPHEYAMTGPDGYELSDRWNEALILKNHVRCIWAALDAEDAASRQHA